MQVNSLPSPSSKPNEPVEVTEPLTSPPKTALPPSDISNVSAVIVVELSTPLNTMSLSLVADFITKSEDTLIKLPNSVPPSFNTISVPSASSIISPPASIVKSSNVDTLGIAASLPLTYNFFQLGMFFYLRLVTQRAHFPYGPIIGY